MMNMSAPLTTVAITMVLGRVYAASCMDQVSVATQRYTPAMTYLQLLRHMCYSLSALLHHSESACFLTCCVGPKQWRNACHNAHQSR